MVSFSVNLSTIFTEVSFLNRFKMAKEAGFTYVESQFPYEAPIDSILTEMRKHQLSMVLINLPAGDWHTGDRGLAVFPNRLDEFKQSVELGIEYATALGVPNIHCMAGVLANESAHLHAREVYIENIKYAAEKMAQYDINLLIEPLNQYDNPGYFLTDINEAVKIIDEIEMPNVKLQFDFYHVQRIQGNLLSTFQQYADKLGHIQIADVPGRHQPGTGEINYQNVLKMVSEQGYKGFVGLEYTPIGKSEESFSWMGQVNGQ